MNIDLTAIKNAKPDDKVLDVYKRLKKYAGQPQRKAWLKKRRDCWDAVYEDEEHTTIWTEEQRKAMEDKGMIPLVINDLYKGVQGSSAVVTDQKPGVTFLPVGTGDLYVAELFRRAFEQVWASNDGGIEAFEFVRECKVGGLAAFDVRHDPAKGIFGKLVLGNYDVENIYFDMETSRKPDLSDTDIIKARLVTKSYARETYDLEDADLVLATSIDKPEAGGKVEDTATGVDNYTRDAKADTPDMGDEEQADVWEIEAHLLSREQQLWLMIPDVAGGWIRKVFKKSQRAEAEKERDTSPNAVLWPRTVEKRVLRIVVGSKLIPQMQDGQEVDEIDNPLGVDVDGDPVVPIVVQFHDRTRRGKPISPTVFAKEACRERNKRRAQAIYVVTKEVDAPLYSAGESVRWQKDKVHGDVMIVDKSSPFPPGRLGPGTVSIEALKLEQVAKQDVDDIYDMQDVMKGKIPAGDPSGRLVLALQDMAGMMSKPFTRSHESALVRLGKVVMAIVLKTWPRQMWERLIEEDEWSSWIPEKQRKPVDPMTGEAPEIDEAQAQQVKSKWKQALDLIRPADPTQEPGIGLIDVDIRVAAGSTMPTNRAARAVEARENVKMGLYDAEAALDYIDDPKKDQIAARMRQKEAQMLAAGLTQKGGK